MKQLRPLRRQALRLSFHDSVWTSAMVGTAETFAIIYAVRSGVTPSGLGILSTLPVLIGSLAQWRIPGAIPARHLKRAILTAHAVQMLGLILLLASSLGAFAPAAFLFWLLLALSFYWVGGMVSSPLWLDWIAAWMPQAHFARYLSLRNAWVAVSTLFFYAATALLLERKGEVGSFVLPFCVALVARLISWLVVRRQPSPPESLRERYLNVLPTDHRDFRVVWTVIAFTVLFKFACNVSSPYFVPYMLGPLHLNLLSFVVLTSVPFIGRSLFLTRWGEATRSMRPFIGLVIAFWGIAINPMLWTLTTQLSGLCLIESLSGMLWGGFDLCAVLIIQHYGSRGGGARKLLGLHLAAMSLSSLMGAAWGARLLEHGLSYKELFQFSSNLRLVVAMGFGVMLWRFRETRTPLRVYGDFLITVVSLRPGLGRLLLPQRRRLRAGAALVVKALGKRTGRTGGR